MTGVDAPAGERSSARLGWAVVALLTATLLVTWLPLSAPFGDDHDGRTLVLNAIQVEQVQRRGLVATDLGSSLAPYVEARTYAHHPPSMKLAYLAAGRLPVSLATSTRLVSYALGALTLPALALLLRRLSVPWGGAVVAVAAMAAVPMFWAYGRIHGPLGASVLLAAVVADLRRREQVGTVRLAASAALAAFVAASNWLSLATAALLGLWLLAGRRRIDRVVVVVGAAMAVAAAATLVWVVALSGTQELAGSMGERATATGLTVEAWLGRMGRWADDLLPGWWRLLAILAVVGAAVERRVRRVAVAAGVLAIGWVVALPGGSFVHDYWLLPLVLPVALGAGGLVARLLAERSARLDRGVVLAAGAAGVVGVLVLSSGTFGAEYETAPRDMPVAAAEAPPPAGQEVAWHARNIPGRLTVAWAWGMPARPLGRQELAAAAPSDHVVVRLDRVPGITDDADALAAAALATEGDYGVVTVATLRELAGVAA